MIRQALNGRALRVRLVAQHADACYTIYIAVAILGSSRNTLWHPMASLVIGKRVVISWGEQPPWFPDVETLDGVEFVKLTHRDTGYVRFVGPGAQGSFLEWAKNRRHTAVMELNKPAEGLFAAAGSATKQRKLIVSKIAVGDLPDVVEIQAPELKCEDGTIVPGMMIKCATCVDKAAAVKVELTVEVLQYIRAAAAMSWSTTEPALETSKSVKWKAARNSYVASRAVGGKLQYKTFRPTDGGNPAEAFAAAEAWVAEAPLDGDVFAE